VNCLQHGVAGYCTNVICLMHSIVLPLKDHLCYAVLPCYSSCAAVVPCAQAVLADDPYFVLKDNGTPNPNVRLRVSRLSQLIGHPEMVEEYRWSVDGQ
jgi:hypothetical protein